ncbi:hypothetical protein SDC9_57799 [bioreactor metagenome]|uniref:Uncharacterized protein n=1 Tax=bioreactor metagenome TaxID=1076179 RepID=A0A644X5Q9_9ZZZZ
MNNARRKILSCCLEMLRKAGTEEEIESAKAIIESILDEENDSRENTPESLQESDQYCKSEEASDDMESAVNALEDAISALEDNEDQSKSSIREAIEYLEGISGVH